MAKDAVEPVALVVVAVAAVGEACCHDMDDDNRYDDSTNERIRDGNNDGDNDHNDDHGRMNMNEVAMADEAHPEDEGEEGDGAVLGQKQKSPVIDIGKSKLFFSCNRSFIDECRLIYGKTEPYSVVSSNYTVRKGKKRGNEAYFKENTFIIHGLTMSYKIPWILMANLIILQADI
jgi:hypothetical protein